MMFLILLSQPSLCCPHGSQVFKLAPVSPRSFIKIWATLPPTQNPLPLSVIPIALSLKCRILLAHSKKLQRIIILTRTLLLLPPNTLEPLRMAALTPNIPLPQAEATPNTHQHLLTRARILLHPRHLHNTPSRPFSSQQPRPNSWKMTTRTALKFVKMSLLSWFVFLSLLVWAYITTIINAIELKTITIIVIEIDFDAKMNKEINQNTMLLSLLSIEQVKVSTWPDSISLTGG